MPRVPARRLFRRLSLEQLERREVLDGSVVITEFVASNDLGLEDEDGDRSDWIELFNSGDAPIDLQGWHLTDRAEDLDKWTFPSVTLAAQDYLVVFTSGKDRVDAAAQLHTNFRLSRDGEYLALVKPDGLTVATDFGEKYSSQYADVSFGLVQASHRMTLVSSGAPARTWIPTAEGNGIGQWGEDWTRVQLDDSNWIAGITGVGFERNTGYESLLGIDIGDTMHGATAGVFVRVPFTVENPASIHSLVLQMKYDDGYVAYLNGTEIARSNAPDQLDENARATTSRSDTLAIEFEDVDVSAYLSQLREGENVLAIHGLNRLAGDSDFLVLPELLAEISGATEGDEGRFFETPTPGRPNGLQSYAGKVSPTALDVGRGFYNAPVNATVTATTAGATIIYTTDGSVPSWDNGTQMPPVDHQTSPTGTLRIEYTSTIRVGGFKTGFLPSRIDTQTYIFLDDVIRQSPDGDAPPGWPTAPVNGQAFDYGMDPDIVNDPEYTPLMKDAMVQVPTISIVTSMQHLFDRATGFYVHGTQSQSDGRPWERPTSVELINPDGSEGFQIDAGIRMRGGASRAGENPKHSFRLLFRGEYGATKLRYPMFGDEGVDEFDNLDLRTAQGNGWNYCITVVRSYGLCHTSTMVRDIFGRDTQRDLGQPYTRSRYYHLYLNGQYWGLYQSEERPEASFAESYFGGEKSDYDVIKVEAGQYVIQATDGDLNAWRQLWELAKAGFADDEAYYRVQGLNVDGVRDGAYPLLLDLDNLIDYMLVIFYTGNNDAPILYGGGGINNWYAIRDRNGEDGFRFFIHDAEWGLLNAGDNRLGPFTPGDRFEESNPHWIHQQLMENAQYRLRFADRAHKYLFNGGVFSPEASLARLQDRVDQIDLAIITESARWGDAYRDPPYTKDYWQKQVNLIMDNILPKRTRIVVEQLQEARLPSGKPAPLYPDIAAPVFSQHGGEIPAGFELTMDGPGAVYFTLDGSDPRRGPATIEYSTLVPESTPARVWVPIDDSLGSTWQQVSFDDSDWLAGRTGIGTRFDTLINTDVESAMSGVNTTAYVRVPFHVDDSGDFDTLKLLMKYDDGFVAYLNGTEVARRNAPDDLTWDSQATTSRRRGDVEQYQEIDISGSAHALRPGQNVLAIHGLNVSLKNADFLVLPALQGGVTTDTGRSETGQAYSFPLVVTQDVAVMARSYLGGHWSTLNAAAFSVESIGFTPQAGDANLDRQFDQLDVVQLLQYAKFLIDEPATWSEGDWNEDGVFDELDLITALQTGNYMQGPYAKSDASVDVAFAKIDM